LSFFAPLCIAALLSPHDEIGHLLKDGTEITGEILLKSLVSGWQWEM
jgi:hypothetical protein